MLNHDISLTEIEQYEGQTIDGDDAFGLLSERISDEIDHKTTDHEIAAIAESIDAEAGQNYSIDILIGDFMRVLTDYRDAEYNAAINEAAYQIGTTGTQNLFEVMPT